MYKLVYNKFEYNFQTFVEKPLAVGLKCKEKDILMFQLRIYSPWIVVKLNKTVLFWNKFRYTVFGFLF